MSPKPVTMRQVADFAGVSTTTVSHVLNATRPVSDDLRQRVFQAIAELNYQPNVLARSLRRNETYTIGLIIPNNANPFYAELARAVEKVSFEAGYSVVLCNSDRDLKKEVQYAELMVKKRVDGIIFVGAWVGEHIEHLARIQQQGMPLVSIDRNTHGLAIDCVIADNALGGRQATGHLIELGHERIACIGGFPTGTPNAERITGYHEALQRAALPLDDELLLKADFQFDGGYDAARQLLDSSAPPSAIFACNDLMAIGAIRAALDVGKQVPRDLSIVGFDDISIASFSNPALTTINHPKYDMGFLAASMLIERIQDEEQSHRKEILPTELILRQSTQLQATS